jgi:DNA repair exonuclease SbcCD ATPase subunit
MHDLQKELSSISQNLSESKSSLEGLNNLENKVLQNKKTYISLRKLGLAKLISVSQSVEKAKAAVKTCAERQELETEYKVEKNKLNNYKKQIILLESELTKLRSQRDETVGSVASLEAEIIRIDKGLEEEKRRINSLNETQEQINIVVAYRSILDPKTGIANYLLKKSRSYLEKAVNSVLGECRAPFRVYISDELELSISSASLSSQHYSEKLLSATLGSGYQKFVLSLAFRTALWKLAEVPLLNCQFIDEGFGCCDEDNLETIIQYLVSSVSAPNAPRIIFIVSHIEALKNAIQSPLIINIELSGNKVDNES